jgi:hypothetical protein
MVAGMSIALAFKLPKHRSAGAVRSRQNKCVPISPARRREVTSCQQGVLRPAANVLNAGNILCGIPNQPYPAFR